MQVTVHDPTLQNILFEGLFILILLFTIQRKNKLFSFSPELTEQLKGFAILAIIFSHIGYFLSTDDHFLWPLSIIAGVGVNLFLFLSGFGLTLSDLKKPLGVVEFYKKRLTKLFFPMWAVIFILVLLDFLLTNKTYPIQTLIQSVVGFFPKANLYESLNSPLWYFTLILFYYLLFPLLFWRKFPYVSPLGLALIPYLLLNLGVISSTGSITGLLQVDIGVLSLYKVHFLSFPLGVALALGVYYLSRKTTQLFQPLLSKKVFSQVISTIVLVILLGLFGYYSVHTGVGEGLDTEQRLSLFTMGLAVLIFYLSVAEFKLFSWFGKFSYEVYLIHWPLMYRYDVLYKFLPPFLATALYLILFILLSILLQRFLDVLPRVIFRDRFQKKSVEVMEK